jgi:hypothetical protein
MIKLLARRWLRSFSERYRYDTGYMEKILDVRLSVFLKYACINLLASHRSGIPQAPWWAARIRAAMWEDCGPCVQLVCNMAVEAGVRASVVTAVVAADTTGLDDEVLLALQFTERVLARDSDADVLRERVRQHWGEDGLVSLAMAISSTRVYPSVKYVLGYGHACTRVQVGRQSVAPGSLRSATLLSTPLTGTAR